MTGYEIGQTPPGLQEDGSFDLPIGGLRGSAFIDDFGRILSVDKETNLLVEKTEDKVGES